jgi:hypothetical protein
VFDEQAARDHRIVTPFGVFLLFQHHLPVCDVFLFVLSIVDGYKVVWRVGNIYIYASMYYCCFLTVFSLSNLCITGNC